MWEVGAEHSLFSLHLPHTYFTKMNPLAHILDVVGWHVKRTRCLHIDWIWELFVHLKLISLVLDLTHFLSMLLPLVILSMVFQTLWLAYKITFPAAAHNCFMRHMWRNRYRGFKHDVHFSGNQHEKAHLSAWSLYLTHPDNNPMRCDERCFTDENKVQYLGPQLHKNLHLSTSWDISLPYESPLGHRVVRREESWTFYTEVCNSEKYSIPQLSTNWFPAFFSFVLCVSNHGGHEW